MLKRVLGVEPHNLTIEVFEHLVDNQQVEHQRLEYKSELPGNSPDQRREFARDVASMANGGGGLLILGIGEGEEDNAAEIAPVELGEQITRMQQIASSLIEPYLQIHIHDIGVNEGREGVIVVEIQPSARRPFAVIEGSRLGYYRRTNRNRHSMDEAEVASMYQARTGRLESTARRASSLLSAAVARLDDDAPPVVILTGVPAESFDRLFRTSRATEGRIRGLPHEAIFGQHVGRLLADDIRPKFKGFELSSSFRSLSTYGWLEIHDDGSFVSVIPGDADLRRSNEALFWEGPGPDEVKGGFYDTTPYRSGHRWTRRLWEPVARVRYVRRGRHHRDIRSLGVACHPVY